jgi:hypothetical protein
VQIVQIKTAQFPIETLSFPFLKNKSKHFADAKFFWVGCVIEPKTGESGERCN